MAVNTSGADSTVHDRSLDDENRRNTGRRDATEQFNSAEASPDAARRHIVVGLFAFLLLAVGTVVAGWQLFGKEDRLDPAEVVLEGVGSRRLGPFVRQSAGRSSAIGAARAPVVPSDQLTVLRGDLEGLHGSRAGAPVCGRDQLARLLLLDERAALGWAEVSPVKPAEVRSLTPVVLRHDLLVTDHDWDGTRVTARQAVLEAGTAVLVDGNGVPVVRCASGSPLLAPNDTPLTVGSRLAGAWAGFDPRAVVAIVPGEPLTILQLVDLAGGPALLRPIGSAGERDIIGGRGAGEAVVVPDLTLGSADFATEVLTALGLGIEFVETPSREVNAGAVVRSRPPAGTRLEVGSVVSIDLSTGLPAPDLAVPDVVGLRVDEALVRLETTGFRVLTETDDSRAVPSGEVIRTEPAAGTVTSTDRPIRVIVSRLASVRVPDVRGLTLDEGRSELVEFGLRPLVVERFHPTTPAGRIIGTQPGTNTKLLATSSVTMAISLGPPPERRLVPDVGGLTVEEAEVLIRGAGFVVDYDQTESETVPAGLVAFSVPGDGTNYIVGSPVKLIISVGPPPERIIVPDVRGTDAEQAAVALRALRLSVTVSDTHSPTVPVGDVVSLIPGPGTRLLEAGQITLYRSIGPEPPEEPTTIAPPAAPDDQESDPPTPSTETETDAIEDSSDGDSPEGADTATESDGDGLSDS